MFRTEAPREALLASLPIGAEAEVVVDPALLGEIVEVPREEWETWPEPVTLHLPDGRVAVTPPLPGKDYSRWLRPRR